MYKYKLGILSAGLLAGAMLVALALCVAGPIGASAASGERAGTGVVAPSEEEKVLLSVEPQSTTVEVNGTFTVTLRVQAGTKVVDVASAYLNFNPKVLQVVTIVPGTALSEIGWWLGDFVDNEQGHINYGAYAAFGQSGATGAFDLAAIQLRAIRASVDTSIAFSSVEGRKTELVTAGYPLPLTTVDGQVVINEATPTPTPKPEQKVNFPLILVG